MSYTNETTYYSLPLPTGSDKSTFTDNNTAFQAVDAALHTAYEQSGAATEDIVAIKATVANLIQADIDFQSDLDTEKGKIRNLQDKEVLQDAAIAAVKADAQDMITAYNEPTATSTHAYSVDDFFIYNDVLYRATESIAIGDTIVPDTNCTTTNVTCEIMQLESVSAVVLVPVSPTGITINNDKSARYGNIVNINTRITINTDRTAGNALIGLPEGVTPLGVVGTSTQFNAALTFEKISGGTPTTLIAYEWQKLGNVWYINTPASLLAEDSIFISGSVVVE